MSASERSVIRRAPIFDPHLNRAQVRNQRPATELTQLSVSEEMAMSKTSFTQPGCRPGDVFLPRTSYRPPRVQARRLFGKMKKIVPFFGAAGLGTNRIGSSSDRSRPSGSAQFREAWI